MISLGKPLVEQAHAVQRLVNVADQVQNPAQINRPLLARRRAQLVDAQGERGDDVLVARFVNFGPLARAGGHERKIDIVPLGFAELFVVVFDPIGPGRGAPHGPAVERNVVGLFRREEFLPVRVLLEDGEDRLALLGREPLIGQFGDDHVTAIVPGLGRRNGNDGQQQGQYESAHDDSLRRGKSVMATICAAVPRDETPPDVAGFCRRPWRRTRAVASRLAAAAPGTGVLEQPTARGPAWCAAAGLRALARARHRKRYRARQQAGHGMRVQYAGGIPGPLAQESSVHEQHAGRGNRAGHQRPARARRAATVWANNSMAGSARTR